MEDYQERNFIVGLGYNLDCRDFDHMIVITPVVFASSQGIYDLLILFELRSGSAVTQRMNRCINLDTSTCNEIRRDI